ALEHLDLHALLRQERRHGGSGGASADDDDVGHARGAGCEARGSEALRCSATSGGMSVDRIVPSGAFVTHAIFQLPVAILLPPQVISPLYAIVRLVISAIRTATSNSCSNLSGR